MSGAAVTRRRPWLWLQGLICGAVMALVPATAVMGLALLAPGLVAYALEETAGRPVSRSMLLLGAAAAFAPLRTLWDAGNTLEAAMSIVTDPVRLGMAWVAAGVGWMLSELTQLVGREVLEVLARHRAATLQQERAALEAEWGSLSPPGSAGTLPAEPGDTR